MIQSDLFDPKWCKLAKVKEKGRKPPKCNALKMYFGTAELSDS